MRIPTRISLALLAACLLVASAITAVAQISKESEAVPVIKTVPVVLIPVDTNGPGGPIAALRALQQNNARIIERQAKQLDTLEELKKTANTIRIQARRS